MRSVEGICRRSEPGNFLGSPDEFLVNDVIGIKFGVTGGLVTEERIVAFKIGPSHEVGVVFVAV
jgi:hypothetical protein